MPAHSFEQNWALLVHDTSRLIRRRFDLAIKDLGLTQAKWRVLATLSDSPPLTVGQLALEVLAQQPTVTKTLDRLVAQGWVERRADAADARRSRVGLTPAGQQHVAPLLTAARDHEAQRLRALGVPDLERMREALHALVQHFDDQDGPRPDERSGRSRSCGL
jgi:DNA-binding MarR family transcriptional regulator